MKQWYALYVFLCSYSSIFSQKIFLQKEKKVWFFDHFNLQRTKAGTHVFDAKYRYVFFCINVIKSQAWNHTSLSTFLNKCLPCYQKNATKFGIKNEILHIFYVIKWIILAIL